MQRGNKRYIKGVGMTKFGIDETPTNILTYEAISAALDNSGLTPNDIDAVVVSNTDTVYTGERQRHFNSYIADLIKRKIPIIRTPAVCGGGGAALWNACNFNYNNVLVVGADKVMTSTSQVITDQILEAAERVFEQDEGLIFPAQNALVAQQHMLKYGTTSDDLALVAYKNHLNGSMNPKARFFGKKVSLEEIRNSPIVASPLRLYDCSISVNGAAAVVISNDKSDIEISGSALSEDNISTFEREDMTTWNAVKIASEKAYKQAGVSPLDIDIAEIHDAFTIVEIISYEDLGFCEKGKGAEMIRNKETFVDGKIPVNVSGGLKARGHPISPTGLAQIYEITKQLRKEAEDQQVSNAKIGLAQNIGGAGGTVAVHILKKV